MADPAVEAPPFIGALARLTLLRVRARMQAAAREAGFTDLQDSHWAVLTHPIPDGVRPSELARRARISRQAANHLIGQLEALGYFERRGGETERRLVHVTPRGRALAETILACLRGLHQEWAAEVGEEAFATTLATLRRLARPEERAPIRPDG